MTYQEAAAKIAAHTVSKCGQCRAPYQCCHESHCEVTRQFALEEFGVTLEPTGHPTLPFMGEKGCVVEPYLRPICAVHVCENHLMAFGDWVDEYWKLRETLEEKLMEVINS